MNMQFVKSQSGFLMLKIMIFMIVAGFISVGVMNYFAREDERNLRIENEQKMNAITDAIARFVNGNRRYPCPASFLINPGQPGFGVEDCSLAPGGGRIDDANVPIQVFQGSVPVATLQLPNDYGADAYNSRFSYALSANHMNVVTSNANAGQIIVERYNGSGVLINTLNNVGFVLISHGPEGKGAYRLSGNTGSAAGLPNPPLIPCPNGANANNPSDTNNCSNTSNPSLRTYVDAPYAPKTDINAVNHYDDQIVYTLGLKDTALWAVDPNATNGHADLSLKDGGGNLSVGSVLGPTGDKLTVNGNMYIETNSICAPGASSCNSLQTRKMQSNSEIKSNNITINGSAIGVMYR